MTLRHVQFDDFDSLTWNDAGQLGWRIASDLTCGKCGAYQAADSDPTHDRDRARELAVRLFNAVGWRVDVDTNRTLCPACSGAGETNA